MYLNPAGMRMQGQDDPEGYLIFHYKIAKKNRQHIDADGFIIRNPDQSDPSS